MHKRWKNGWKQRHRAGNMDYRRENAHAEQLQVVIRRATIRQAHSSPIMRPVASTPMGPQKRMHARCRATLAILTPLPMSNSACQTSWVDPPMGVLLLRVRLCGAGAVPAEAQPQWRAD